MPFGLEGEQTVTMGQQGRAPRSNHPASAPVRPSKRPATGSTSADRSRHLLHRAAALDPSTHVIGTSREELREAIASPLAQLVREGLALADELEAARATDPEADDMDFDLAFGPMDDEPSASPCQQDRQSSHVLAVCFGLRHELAPLETQLSDATATHEQLLVACDRARRKLRRSLTALTHALAQEAGRAVDLSDETDGRVDAAVAVRYMYTKFREALPDCPHEPDERRVTACLRRAATALAMLCGDGDFADVRLQDRLLLRDLQRRTLAWGRMPDPREGVRLYSDIRSAADLLRAINMRQELRAHDAQLLLELEARLDELDTDDPELEHLIGRMRALRGLDDELDVLLRRAYAHEPLADLVPMIRAVVHRLALGCTRS
ncbi:MAG: hypothetical protein ACOCXM_08745 [Myxococcota bacterium]